MNWEVKHESLDTENPGVVELEFATRNEAMAYIATLPKGTFCDIEDLANSNAASGSREKVLATTYV
jgi:hypothetical protein